MCKRESWFFKHIVLYNYIKNVRQKYNFVKFYFQRYGVYNLKYILNF